MKRVFSSHDLVAIHHWRNLLESAGIRAEVRNDLLSSGMGELPPAECQAELWILDDEDAELAGRVLRDGCAPAQETQGAWRCRVCGESAEPQFTQCWRCGANRELQPDT
jgi:hypothetical protein